jgi:hypothetical protein
MVFKCVSGVFFECFISMFQVFQLPSDVCCTVVFGCLKRRSGVASLLLPSAASSLPELAGHLDKRGMGNRCGTRELWTSDASEGAPYERMLSLERDGRWVEGYVVVWEQGRRRVVTWAQRASALLSR